jgi:hypothetical protein
LWTDFFCCKIQALRYLRQVAHEDTHSVITGWGRQPAALRALSQKLTRLVSWQYRQNADGSCHESSLVTAVHLLSLFQRFQWSSQWACWWWMVCDWKWWSGRCLYLCELIPE